ncbi:hypothetical protein Ssi03_63280 [Sphaerisporangium siamense]|uniref:GTP-binding protein EngB required for normal cell division n=1 Tax=Sphaerisporangium siamense TaxID=795645 RepID=A0A7W7D558_9ACTN|nr:GTPase [Sphaerisporangium siamense]MBB4700499.1 GTP-binding protein EngB required for normal cell division [Sphaerisporangium siamense]GII88338.1 hypothetical protein Ssi03_63280 [Sphaerisporangium siamense]
MKLLRRTKSLPLDERLAALAEAADLAEGRLDTGAVEAARAVVARAGARRRLSVDHTVVALAGATGSGKSSLFNALSGTSLAGVGVTRPTTSAAQAAMWGAEGAGPLLDWLDIPRRHVVDDTSAVDGAPSSPRDGQEPLPGLILLDLPDHDSIELAHRLEVDRLVNVVDLLVWVLDPQKYADAAVHERYLRPLSRHRDVMMIVLNQVDRLTPSSAGRCLNDLRRLLDEDGLRGVPVLATSAPRHEGVEELRSALARRVADRRAWAARLGADAVTAADTLAVAACDDPSKDADGRAHPVADQALTDLGGRAEAAERAVGGELAGPLTAALAEAAGVPLVVAAVAKAHRHRSITATGWPVTRWLRRFRPDPLRRLRVGVPPSGHALISTTARSDTPALPWSDTAGGTAPVPRSGTAPVPRSGTASGTAPFPRSSVAGGPPSAPGSRAAEGTAAVPGSGAAEGVAAIAREGAPGVRRGGTPAVPGSGAAGGADAALPAVGAAPQGPSRGPSGSATPAVRRARTAPVIGRTSIPPATAIQRSQMDMAIREAAAEAAEGLPEPWALAVRRASRSRADELADRLDQAVSVASVGAGRRPRWWRAVGVLQWLVFAVMIAGLLWLSALFLVDYMRLPEVPTPTLGVVPWPTVLLAGGAALGVLIALLCRLLAAIGGRRRARKARKALCSSVDTVGRELVLDPMRAELSRTRDFAAHLTTARS